MDLSLMEENSFLTHFALHGRIIPYHTSSRASVVDALHLARGH